MYRSMKKQSLLFVLFVSVTCFMSSCTKTEDVIKESVTNYLRKYLKNPESLKIEAMSIYKDTVPYYISTEVLDMAEDCVETLEEYTKYSERGRLWEEEKTKAMFEHMFARMELENVKDSLLNKESVNIEYLACVNYSGTNAMGGIVSSRSIFIMDKEEPSKILGVFDADEDFVKKVLTIKMILEDFEIKSNQYGKYETDNMSNIEQFIFHQE